MVSNSEDDLSDIKSITGEYPAVIGFDVGGTFSADDRKRSAYLIKKASDRGLLITIAWHLSNPISDGSPWVNKDNTGEDIRHSIRRILPNGDVHSKFKYVPMTYSSNYLLIFFTGLFVGEMLILCTIMIANIYLDSFLQVCFYSKMRVSFKRYV